MIHLFGLMCFCLTFGSLYNFVDQFIKAEKKFKGSIPSYEMEVIISNLVWTMLGGFGLAVYMGES